MKHGTLTLKALYFSLTVLLLAPAIGMPARAASGTQDPEFVKALRQENGAAIATQIAAGRDPNFRMPGGKTPLMVAAKIGDYELVRLLLSRGADVNARTNNGGTPLMFSAIRGNPDVVQLLIERGADVNAVAHFDWTALMVASAKGHDEAIRVLLENGANANVADVYGWTPLMRAVYQNRYAAVAVFLENGDIRLDAVDETGSTALHHAAAEGHLEIARLLLNKGATLRATNAEGLTPLAIARKLEQDAMVRFLESWKSP
ncbi:MAG: ankyrin repeat domain-containing protein [Gammaproteobacteria bacterium]|nr:ankyrin repeat domain-containing protein [Gammaproteobacteria bacterium]